MDNNQGFKFKEARSLPVILLLDTSGSMSANGNIDVLNSAVREMLADFSSQHNNEVSIDVAIYAFGPEAKQIIPFKKAAYALEEYEDMEACGGTPLGETLTLVKETLIEDKNALPSRSYRPMIVLVSDGMPNDEWESPLQAFCETGRSSKCFRMSLSIGNEKGTEAYEMLRKFASNSEMVFTADSASTIKRFFKFVTISTVGRSQSLNPNEIIAKKVEEIYDEDDIF